MVLNISIPDGMELLLAEQAALRGQSVESYATDLIREGIHGGRSFAEILAPFREELASTGIQDVELDCMFEAARDEVYTAKQGHE